MYWKHLPKSCDLISLLSGPSSNQMRNFPLRNHIIALLAPAKAPLIPLWSLTPSFSVAGHQYRGPWSSRLHIQSCVPFHLFAPAGPAHLLGSSALLSHVCSANWFELKPSTGPQRTQRTPWPSRFYLVLISVVQQRANRLWFSFDSLTEIPIIQMTAVGRRMAEGTSHSGRDVPRPQPWIHGQPQSNPHPVMWRWQCWATGKPSETAAGCVFSTIKLNCDVVEKLEQCPVQQQQHQQQTIPYCPTFGQTDTHTDA